MKRKFTVAVIILSIFIFFYTCTENTNPVIDDSPVIDPITNTWSDSSNNNYEFSFTTFDSTVSRGIFFGEEDHPNFGFSDLCGFFDKTYVEFDVRRVDGRIKFKGNFETSNRLKLQSVEGTLVLIR